VAPAPAAPCGEHKVDKRPLRGPIGNSLPRDEIEFDIRPGGYQRWTEVFPAQPDVRVHIYIDLTDVADGELLDGVMHVTGRLPGGFEPFETQFRVEFYDEADGRQWLPLYGRRLYETMAVWETDPALAAKSQLSADFADVWHKANKVVYSTTLHALSTANARLEGVRPRLGPRHESRGHQ
jgi:hypothetical protein